MAALAAVLLLLGAGAVVWYVGFGQFTRVPATGCSARPGRTPSGGSRTRARRRLDARGVQQRVRAGHGHGDGPGARRAHPRQRLGGPRPLARPGDRPGAGPQGQPLAAAKERLRRAGLAAGVVTREFDAEVARGSVVGTDPPAGTERSPDAAVALVVSRGAPIVVPNAAGRSPEAARTALTGAGLRVEVAGERVHSSHPAGSVAAQSLPAGARAAEGDTVTLTLSKGPRPVAVPDVTGQDVGDAVRRLEDAGFEVKVERSFPYLGDTVGAQSVPGGGTAPRAARSPSGSRGSDRPCPPEPRPRPAGARLPPRRRPRPGGRRPGRHRTRPRP